MKLCVLGSLEENVQAEAEESYDCLLLVFQMPKLYIPTDLRGDPMIIT